DGDLSSAGHAALAPVQSSAGSHSPADGRQTTVDGASTSAGHVVVVPSHVSSRSHGPAAARQTVPAFAAGCWQALLERAHTSAVPGVPSPVQGQPAALLPSPG